MSSINLSKVKIKDKRGELNFDLIAFPAPTVYKVWFSEVIVNSSEPSYVQSSTANISCRSIRDHSFVFRCNLIVFNVSQSGTGYYKVQVANDHGEENFTVEVIYGE